jgi:hypothetical protein
MYTSSIDLRAVRIGLAIMITTLVLLASVAFANAGSPSAIPVEPDGGIGGEVVLPVEPDGGIGGEVVLPVEPDGGIGD